jgi:hypothetical protein
MGRLARASVAGIGAVVLALAGITLGTLHQKKYCTDMDLRTERLGVLSIAGFAVTGGAAYLCTRPRMP